MIELFLLLIKNVYVIISITTITFILMTIYTGILRDGHKDLRIPITIIAIWLVISSIILGLGASIVYNQYDVCKTNNMTLTDINTFEVNYKGEYKVECDNKIYDVTTTKNKWGSDSRRFKLS